MSELRPRLAAIERQMSLLEAQMSALRDEREMVALELEGIVYPVLTLPNEILSEIVLQYVCDQSQYNPLLLTWVCRLWREVRSPPTGSGRILFACIPVPHISPSKGVHLNNLPSTACCFVVFACGNSAFAPALRHPLTSEKSQELLQVVTTYSSQWETLSVDIALFPTDRCFSFPRLTKLELIPREEGPTILPILSDSPRLRELYAEGYRLTRPSSAFPCAQLTKLSLDTDLETCLEFLAQTPNVEELYLSVESMEHPPPSLSPISLPLLHTLELGMETSPIFTYITLPALNKLGMYIQDDDPPTMVTEFADFIARSSCSIRMLELRLLFASRESVNRLLVSAPLQTVRVLTIDGLDVRPNDDILTDLLTPMTEYNDILPALEAFKIENLYLRDGLRRLFSTLADHDDMSETQAAARAKPFQLFSNAVLEAYATAKNREQLQIETKLEKLRQSLSQLELSAQANAGCSELE
ncbi:hypothetical protein FB45DRAFT_1025330 [Roridomyces roridus]|uniref:F-box domain-containing protein n=1 Tax=Roridomyces roridus TaxID=1738132 RepID=A0AAD7BYE9_9AGAR|nr:hypothetical protein FB45DRAFT_1025330 [Roridomyces roridus]